MCLSKAERPEMPPVHRAYGGEFDNTMERPVDAVGWEWFRDDLRGGMGNGRV